MTTKNGERWARGMFAGIGLMIGLLTGASSIGVFLGSQAKANTIHRKNLSIHEPPDVKTERVRTIIDREIKLQLTRIEKRLERIEEKL